MGSQLYELVETPICNGIYTKLPKCLDREKTRKEKLVIVSLSYIERRSKKDSNEKLTLQSCLTN